LGISGEPTFVSLQRWHDALPQYEIGHAERISQIEQALERFPICLVGTSYKGVGIPDCIAQGKEAAHKAVAAL
jgi:oxygen-dependent protoporphyrinogen oxidase